MRKIILTSMIALILLSLPVIVYAGYGECKRCSCYGYEDRGDLICRCGHGYGNHWA